MRLSQFRNKIAADKATANNSTNAAAVNTCLPIFLSVIEPNGGLLTQAQVYEWSWHMHSQWGWLWVIGLILVMLLFWGIFFLGLFVALRWMLGKVRGKRQDKALEILRQRYARGEITKEDFEAKKYDLQ